MFGGEPRDHDWLGHWNTAMTTELGDS
jgi:hypothetical protein